MATRRGNLTLLGFVIAALVGVALLAIPQSPLHREIKLGLDLQGGVELVLKAIPPKGEEVTEENLDLAIEVIRNRVDALGVAEPEIRQQGKDQISIQLPGVADADKAAELIGKTAQLWLFDVNENTLDPTRDENGFPVPVRGPVPAPEGAPAPDEERREPRVLPRRPEGEEGHLRPRGLRGADPPRRTGRAPARRSRRASRSGGSRRRRSSSPAASASATARASTRRLRRATTTTSSGSTRRTRRSPSRR